jgi:hypothetical protein
MQAQRAQPDLGRRWAHPALLLAAAVAGALLLLAVPLRLPLGAMYWDAYFILDGAHRIGHGQVPHRDFFVPAGALPFYLMAGALKLMPGAQLLLAGQYALLIVTAPLMALVAIDTDQRSRALAVGLVLPFIVLSLLPFNAISFYPAPGVDGVGLYNRQSGLVLYVLMAAMFAMSHGPSRVFVLGASLAALFFLKINAFLPALVLVAYAAVAGLLTGRATLGVVALLMAIVLGVGWPSGLLSAYLADLAAMASHNAGQVPARLLTLLSVKFDVVLPLALLALALLAVQVRQLAAHLAGLLTGTFAARVARLRLVLTSVGMLLGICLVMAIAIEMQNTGSQEFAFLWPLIWLILLRLLGAGAQVPPRRRAMALLLISLCTLPTAVTLVHRAARTLAVMPGYAALGHPELKALNGVTVKPTYLDHARAIGPIYAEGRQLLARFAETGQMPSPILFSQIEYQAFYLLDLAEAAVAVRRLEQARGAPFASLYTLHHLDPMPYLLGRAPLPGVTVALDPGRGFPASRRARLIAAAAGAEALLIPNCPTTPFTLDVVDLFAAALADRRFFSLTPCWDIALRM